MRKFLLVSSLASLLMVAILSPLPGKDQIINGGFEGLQEGFELYFGMTGFEVPDWGVEYFDVVAGTVSHCLRTDPYVDVIQGTSEGWITQPFYVQAGQTYKVSADICYTNC
jgi:hypothetical protein